MSTVAQSWLIRGRVQGVGYRDWMVREARRLGIDGWVRNRATGEVEALVRGPAGALATLEAACRRGPPASGVTAIDIAPAPAPAATGFERRADG